MLGAFAVHVEKITSSEHFVHTVNPTHTHTQMLSCWDVTSLSTMTHCATTCIVVHVASCALLEYPLPRALPATL